MKTKKILVRFFIVCMVVMSFTTTAFANIVDDLKKEPNAMALVTIDNEDCTEIANLKDLSVRITAPGTNINIIIPVEEVKEDGETLGLWLGYPKDRISDAIMKELAENPLYLDTELRKKNADSLKKVIEEWASDKTVMECVEIIDSVGVPAGPIYNCEQVCADKNITETREMLVKVPHKEAGDLTVIGNPIKMNEYPCQYKKAAPDLGEDNFSIFASLGFSREDLEKYREEGVIN